MSSPSRQYSQTKPLTWHNCNNKIMGKDEENSLSLCQFYFRTFYSKLGAVTYGTSLDPNMHEDDVISADLSTW